MSHTKYICIEIFRNNCEAIVTFPDYVDHNEVALALKDLGNIISAGRCSFYKDENGQTKGSCFGESVSLKLKSRPEEDSSLLNMQLRE